MPAISYRHRRRVLPSERTSGGSTESHMSLGQAVERREGERRVGVRVSSRTASPRAARSPRPSVSRHAATPKLGASVKRDFLVTDDIRRVTTHEEHLHIGFEGADGTRVSLPFFRALMSMRRRSISS